MKKLFAVLFLSAAVLAAADISGTWNFNVETEMGSGAPVFVLKQSGEKLSGTYSGALGEAQVTGAVKGDEVTIEFELQGARIVYTGKVDSSGSTMKGKVDLGGMASGTFTASKQK